MQRRVRALPADAGEVAVGRVEVLQHRIGQRAAAERVERPAIAVRPGLLVPGQRRVTRAQQALGNRRIDAWAAELWIQQAAGGQRDVADDLPLDAKPRAAGQQPIVTDLARHSSGVDVRRLPIRGRVHDQPVHCFEAPAGVHELAGQPIEQFRMAGRFALHAEILARADDARAEVRLPDAIHHHAGRRRAGCDRPASGPA